MKRKKSRGDKIRIYISKSKPFFVNWGRFPMVWDEVSVLDCAAVGYSALLYSITTGIGDSFGV